MSAEQLKNALVNSGWFYIASCGGLEFGYMEGVDMHEYINDLLDEINKVKE